uniref:Putative secreted protein n=1 Tax=Anopheles darlingi TaxID=43151 RepID=A0A2M4DNK8_ANODA
MTARLLNFISKLRFGVRIILAYTTPTMAPPMTSPKRICASSRKNASGHSSVGTITPYPVDTCVSTLNKRNPVKLVVPSTHGLVPSPSRSPVLGSWLRSP